MMAPSGTELLQSRSKWLARIAVTVIVSFHAQDVCHVILILSIWSYIKLFTLL